MSNINVPYDDDYGEEHYGQNGNGRAQQLYAQQANGAYQPQGRYANGAGGRQVVALASAPAKQQTTVKTGAQANGVVASGENGGANATAIDQALSSGKTTHTIGAPLTYQWPGPGRLAASSSGADPKRAIEAAKQAAAGLRAAARTNSNASADDGSVLVHAPLPNLLVAKKLCPEQPVNVSELYVEKLHNVSKSPIGIQVTGLNGQDLKKNIHQDGQWSTLTVLPGQQLDYTHLNGGRGLLLSANKLSSADEINVNMSPADMLAAAVPHKNFIDASGAPTKFIVDLDFSGFADPSITDPAEQLAVLEKNPAGLIVYANAKHAVHSQVPHELVARLPPITAEDLNRVNVLPGLEVSKAEFGKPGEYRALVDAQAYRDLVESYANDNQSKAAPTVPKEHKIAVFRMNGNDKEHIGDLSKELGVTQSDIDRSDQVTNGLHAHFNYVLQHNGTKHTGTVNGTTANSSTTTTNGKK